MAKGSGGTRTNSPHTGYNGAIQKINSKIKGDFTPKSVFGHTLTLGDNAGVSKLRSWLTGGTDPYDINFRKLDEVLSARGKEVDVKTSDIYPIQKYLNKEQVARYIANPSQNLSNRKLSVTGYRLPNGKVLLDDGHHRVAAQIINGSKTVKVRVVDINDYYASKFFRSIIKK